MSRRAALTALLACLAAARCPAAAAAPQPPAANLLHRLADPAEPAWRRTARLQPAQPGQQASQALARTGSALAQQFLRSSRAGGRKQYDVPLIECPPDVDGMERFACPKPDRRGRYRCIDDHMLCDGYVACPGGEDEDRQNCMFYKTTKTHLNVLADALLRWLRGR